jgi:hypothetical protein
MVSLLSGVRVVEVPGCFPFWIVVFGEETWMLSRRILQLKMVKGTYILSGMKENYQVSSCGKRLL